MTLGKTLKALIDPRSPASSWLYLFITYILLGVLITGFARWEFSYTILYAFYFFAIALVLAISKPNVVSGILVAVMGIAVLLVQVAGFPVEVGLGAGIAGFIAMLVVEAGIFKRLKKAANPGVKYLDIMPFLLLLAYVFAYFFIRIRNGMLLDLPTILNHAGIAIIAFDGIFRLRKKWSKTWYFMVIGILVTIAGAVWLTIGLGRGLATLP